MMSMGQYRVLVVEDDATIRAGLKDALESQGWEVLCAEEGKKGLALAVTEFYDVALLDVVLPGLSGWDILKGMGMERPGVPVIMLTAKGEEDDRVKGLELGADDYLVKPFSMRELLARMQAVLRRSPERSLPVTLMQLKEVVFNLAEHTLLFPASGVKGEEEGAPQEDRVVSLSQREFELLRYFVAHPGRIISRDELLRRVWNVDPRSVATRTVEMTLTRLREKLGEELSLCLENKRGLGYRWDEK